MRYPAYPGHQSERFCAVLSCFECLECFSRCVALLRKLPIEYSLEHLTSANERIFVDRGKRVIAVVFTIVDAWARAFIEQLYRR